MNNRQQATLHGNNCIVKVAGKSIARLQNATFEVNTDGNPLYEIGTGKPVEINHNRWSYSVSFDLFLMRCAGKDGVSFLNKYPLLIGDLPPFEVELTDRDTRALWVARGCEPTSQTANIPVNAQVRGSMRLVALDIEQVDNGTLKAAIASLPSACASNLDIADRNKDFIHGLATRPQQYFS